MPLSIQQVEHLAKLAKIYLAEDEKEKYVQELSAILDYVKKLQEVKTDAILEIEVNAGRLRDDYVIGLSSLEQDELLNAAPEKQGRLIKTKAVFE